VTVLVAVAFAAGAWNPWRLVVLAQNFSNWSLGLLLVAVLAFVTSWLLLPIQHEVAQGRRIVLRVVTGVAAVVALLCWGLVGTSFGRTSTVVARSADGQRAVAVVERGLDDRELQVWVGTGLTTREVGVLGPACGPVTAQFTGRDEVALSTNYGDFRLRLDPATGTPLDTIGPTCSGTG
jgi:hypothetical protein